MGKTFKRIKLWFHKHVPVPLLLIGSAIVIITAMNENVSLSKSYEYLRQITALKQEIKLNQDSAEYYRKKSKELTTSPQQLEHIAREQYQMQKSDEEVFVLR